MIHNVTLRAIAQATESEERVKKALSLFLFDNEIETIKTEGHYGNPITILQAQIKGRDCRKFIDFLKSKLSESDLERLKNQLTERVDDDCVIHLRFDKQAAYNGTVLLATTTDTIAAQVKLRAYPARREKALAIAKELF